MNGKRILVTGGTGFVGSHLVERLVEEGASVVVPYRSIDPRSYFAIQNLASSAIMVIGDLKDRARIADIVTKYDIEYIFHLGAQPIVETAFYNPVETISTNVLGTTHLLDAALNSGTVRGIIVTSSDKAYGKLAPAALRSAHVLGASAKQHDVSSSEVHTLHGGAAKHMPHRAEEKLAYTEEYPLAGDHPYDASKAAADLVSIAYMKTYHAPITIVRFGNIYGPGDLNFSRIVPDIMRSAITGNPLTVRSDGTFVRDYIHVADVVSAYIFLMMHPDAAVGEAYNVASDTTCSVVDFIAMSEKVLAKKIPFTVANTQKNEIPYQHLDWSKIAALGWKPVYTLAEGLHETYQWYTKYRKIVRL